MTARTATTAAGVVSRAELVLLALIFGIVAYATDMYLPAMPAMAADLDASPAAIQFSLSVFLYANAAGQLVFGPLSDRYGRRPVLLAGLAAYGAASGLCITADSITALYACRVIQGFTSASGPVLIRAALNDRLDPTAAAGALATVIGLMAFIAMLTPVTGGWLVGLFGWQSVFAFIGSLSVLLFAGAFTRMVESLPPTDRITSLRPAVIAAGYRDIACHPAFWSYVLPPAVMFASVFAYVGVNSFLLIDTLGLAPHKQGMLYAIAAGAYVAGSFASGAAVRRFGVHGTILAGLVLGGVSAVAATLASHLLPLSPALVLVPALFSFFATAMVVPAATSTAVSLFPTRAGSASAVAGCCQVGAAGLGTWIAAAATLESVQPLHWLTVACMATALVLWWWGRGVRG